MVGQGREIGRDRNSRVGEQGPPGVAVGDKTSELIKPWGELHCPISLLLKKKQKPTDSEIKILRSEEGNCRA